MVQNRTQNASKIHTIFDIEKITLQDRLGAVLGRFCGILKPMLGGQKRLKPFILKGLVKIRVFDVDKL